MKTLLLTTHANTGGITSYLLTLTQGLVARGHKVFIVSSGGNCVSDFEKLGATHLCLNIRTKSELHPKLFLSLSRLRQLVLKEGIDIIHAQTRVTQVMAYWLGLSTGVAVVTTCHGFFKPRWFRKIFPCWGSSVIAISKPVFDHLRQDFRISQERIRLIVNGIDLKRFDLVSVEKRNKIRGDLKLGSTEFVIGIIARLSDVKAIDRLIHAMPIILNQFPSVKLMIVGEGPQEIYLRRLVEQMSLSSSIRFEKIVNRTEDMLAAFDVFVMPSLMEGLGLSVMEAQACGIPVIASKVGGLVDLIKDGQSGYLVPAGDVKALSTRIMDVLKDLPTAQKMSFKARQNIEDHFSSDLMVERTIKVYEENTRR